jgi:hypothetical protein
MSQQLYASLASVRSSNGAMQRASNTATAAASERARAAILRLQSREVCTFPSPPPPTFVLTQRPARWLFQRGSTRWQVEPCSGVVEQQGTEESIMEKD